MYVDQTADCLPAAVPPDEVVAPKPNPAPVAASGEGCPAKAGTELSEGDAVVAARGSAAGDKAVSAGCCPLAASVTPSGAAVVASA